MPPTNPTPVHVTAVTAPLGEGGRAFLLLRHPADRGADDYLLVDEATADAFRFRLGEISREELLARRWKRAEEEAAAAAVA